MSHPTATGDTAQNLIRARLRQLLADRDPATTPAAEFRGAQYDTGLAWVWFPVGWGGLGLHPDLQDVIDDELARAGAPAGEETSGIALGMAAPTVVAHGSDEQKQRHLRKIFTGEHVWCQLFSEPGAGSDLAGLATQAVRDGDEWVINGQKVWTSFAHIADWAMLLARTDPDVPKHQGLTYFLLDMRSPGVEVRALREMTGEAQFSEVFLPDIRIPDSQRLGAVGDGWRVAISTLMSERTSMGSGFGAPVQDAIAIWRDRGLSNAVQRDALAQLWVRSEANRMLGLRAQQLRKSGVPGPEGSIAKLASAELAQQVYDFCLELLGAESMLFPARYTPHRIERGGQLLAGRDLPWLFVRSRGFTIEGGTSEVQRNILAERILGLPGDARVDRDIPWKQIPRG
ncbi:MAG TPA: acyl-CoA dehydrogenase family protein [Mycobacteriales bacterium]|jgi:alkylation response protein AidB-like acyl-CoA dehydrogenase|nr:acyl-CoA dehydrogenase family protein [Mycobacteriales bacterium]